jgi:hypothetical protein
LNFSLIAFSRSAYFLRASIFGSDFRVQDNPDAEILKMALKQGLMPATGRSRAIVAE